MLKALIDIEENNNQQTFYVSKVSATLMVFFIAKLILVLQFYSTYQYTEEFFFAYGNDEKSYHEDTLVLLNAIEKDSFSNVVPRAHQYVGSLHFGMQFFMAACFSLFNESILSVLIMKLLVFNFVGCYFFYKFIFDYTQNFVLAYRCLLFVCFYPPISLYTVSILREELIFTVFTLSLYFFHRYCMNKKIINLTLALIVLCFVAIFRIHMFVVAVCMWFCFLWYKLPRAQFIKISCFCAIFIVSFSFFVMSLGFGNYFSSIFLGVEKVLAEIDLIHVIKGYIRVALSPLPWKIESIIHSNIIWWYCLSLTLIFLSIMFTKTVFQSINKNFLFLIIILIAYFLPYLTIHDLGPRQFAVIGPYLFFFIYSSLISRLSFSKTVS